MSPQRDSEAAAQLPESLSYERPKGQQLQEFIEDMLNALQPGTMLPSERAIAERYGVARMTVRQELERLVAKGLIYRVQGRGTFVAEPKFAQSERLTSFSEDMRARGMAPGSKVLSQSLEAAPDIVARILEIEPQTPALRIDRVRTADGRPMAYEHAFLPADRFPGLEDENLEDASLYELMARRWNVSLRDAEQTVAAVSLSEDEAELLQVPVGQPAFLIQRITRDSEGRVVEYVRSLYRGDRYEVRTHLDRSLLVGNA